MNGEHKKPVEALSEDLVAQNAAILGAEPYSPIPYEFNGNGEYGVRHVFGGLTKREMLAASVLGHLAAAHVQGSMTLSALVAKQAVEYADALLKELSK